MRLRTGNMLMAVFPFAVVCVALPAGAWAAESTESKWGALLEIGRLVNVLLVLAVLVWVARKPLANFFASRSRAIRDQLAEAQKARFEAEAQLAEIRSRMSSLDDELKEIRNAAEREAREERQRLIGEADRDAQKLIERAKRDIEGMTRAAQLDLKAHVAELSVQLAKERIQSEMTEEDRQRLFAHFVSSVGGGK